MMMMIWTKKTSGQSTVHSSPIFGLCSLVCRHATTLFLSADGHFGLMQKLKNNDPDDVSLLAGAATFPQEESYQEYIKTAHESTGVINYSCWYDDLLSHFTEIYLLEPTGSKCPEQNQVSRV